MEPIGRLRTPNPRVTIFRCTVSQRENTQSRFASSIASTMSCRENSFSRRGRFALKQRGMHNAVTNLFNRTWK